MKMIAGTISILLACASMGIAQEKGKEKCCKEVKCCDTYQKNTKSNYNKKDEKVKVVPAQEPQKRINPK